MAIFASAALASYDPDAACFTPLLAAPRGLFMEDPMSRISRRGFDRVFAG
jgi:hypothetical protein